MAKAMKSMKVNWTNLVVLLSVLMITYLGLTMMIGASSSGMEKMNNGGDDPSFGIDLGTKVVESDGDLVGVYSANITGGVKINYPWPIRDGPGWSVDLNA